ncbi:MAG: flippase-like domain-containing protein [Chitinivibrionia bacterium]|nr:flippase-like domain-containing protein [Chitinivibrionia bacterium]
MKKNEIIILAAKIAATVFLFYFVNKTVNFNEFPQIGNLGLVFFIAVSFGFLQQFLLFLRWFFSLKAADISCSIKSVVKSYFIGQFLGTVSPARSGDLAKIFYLENTPKKRGLYAVLIDGIVALTTLFLVGLWKNYPQNSPDIILIADKILSVAGFLGVVATIAILIIWRKKKPYKILLAAFFQHVVLVVQGAILFSILLPISFTEASFAVASAYCLMPLIPITVAAIGVREFSFALFISAFISYENIEQTVFVASYILLLCNSIIFMLPGIYLFYSNRKPK